MNCHQREAPTVEFPRRLVAGKARRVPMAAPHAVILFAVIAAGAACGAFADLLIGQLMFL